MQISGSVLIHLSFPPVRQLYARDYEDNLISRELISFHKPGWIMRVSYAEQWFCVNFARFFGYLYILIASA